MTFDGVSISIQLYQGVEDSLYCSVAAESLSCGASGVNMHGRLKVSVEI